MNNNQNMNMDFLNGITDQDVLCHSGKGKHPGTSNLRQTIEDNFVDYQEANKQRRKEIANDIVFDVQQSGGRFMKWDKDNQRYFELTNKDAVKRVRISFGNLKHTINQAIPKLLEDPGADVAPRPPPAVQATRRRGEEPHIIGNDFFFSVGDSVATAQRLMNNGDDLLTVGVTSASLDGNHLHDDDPSFDVQFQHQQDQQDDDDDDDETAVLSNKAALREDDYDDSPRAMLLALLSNDEGGKQLAQTLLSIVNSAGHQTITAKPRAVLRTLTLDEEAEETLMAAKESLLMEQRKQSKRFRRNAPETTEGTHLSERLEDDAMTKSSYSSQSVLSFQTKQDIPKLEIVKNLRMGRKKGWKKDRTYTGSTMGEDKKPHGMGFMIYDHGRILCGDWLHGVFQGRGLAIYEETGDMCFGTFLKGEVHGYATFMTKYTKYVGTYYKNQRHGKGLLIDVQRGTYNGDFVQGNFEGPGVYTAMNGDITKGDFVNWKLKEEIDDTCSSEADDEE
ncbi:unnamed protein product [Cylindrotheca closterium]|uniref:DUF6824 domain-containing protein n=1 Tax=Cylindrotheca closterium TaxID=2856 RepID=A0AAD2JGT4_9STRA|nr:unnamed protein product [Cylindrotheca closterium]